MRLSEAMKHGITLRPESHQERFCQVENRGLCSDAWGAACEAVQPAVARFNWTSKDRIKFESAMDAFRAVQHHYFQSYFQMPARCPLASQRFTQAGGRIVNSKGEVKLDGSKTINIGGVTSECDVVNQLAGMVDHLFYAHGWSREQVADVVEWYENQRHGAIEPYIGKVMDFQHYQVN